MRGSRSDVEDLFHEHQEFRDVFDSGAFSEGDRKKESDYMWKKGERLSFSKTGRQRRKLAARVPGSDFQSSRSKRRLYFCCLGTEVDIEKLFQQLPSVETWDRKLLPDVLRLFKSGSVHNRSMSMDWEHSQFDHIKLPSVKSDSSSGDDIISVPEDTSSQKFRRVQSLDSKYMPSKLSEESYLKWQESYEAQEVYIFEFGAAVFWGFPKGEETPLLDFIKTFVTRGILTDFEFERGEDDIAFITSPEATSITIANDVITMSEDVVEKQRLAVSYAYAQSTILAVYEYRIEVHVNEYKHIPEKLAKAGVIHLSNVDIGKMIGRIFTARHNINLHSVILDTPDFFWKEEKFLEEYRMMMKYLEMSERGAIVNKRLNMLQELLVVLQHQRERDHAEKLEWVVILLIFIQTLFEFPIFFGHK